MSALDAAISLAVEAHAGQTDKTGQAYILHPLRVMAAMRTDEERIVAVLHDAIEDGPKAMPRRLQEQGFDAAVMDALKLLTRRPRDLYDRYIAAVGENRLARTVKLADLLDNLDPMRLARLPAADRLRLDAKYMRALRYLRAC